jgi:HEAT repeat protein
MLRILGRMGQGARAAEHDLAAVLENEGEEEPVRLAAFWALGQLGTEGATAAQRRYAAEHPILWSDPAAKP